MGIILEMILMMFEPFLPHFFKGKMKKFMDFLRGLALIIILGSVYYLYTLFEEALR